MNKIIYNQIDNYPKEINYDFYTKYIQSFKINDCIEFSYLNTKEILELTRNQHTIYKMCKECLEFTKLWLENKKELIDKGKFKNLVNKIWLHIKYYTSVSWPAALAISNLPVLVLYNKKTIEMTINTAWWTYKAKPELLPYIQKLIQMYLRTEKQFNIKEHNNTYYENILKQIINTEYNELQNIDKNQIIDIINEYYDIKIDCFDFVIYKTIQREFM